MESKNNWKAWLYLAPIIILLSVFTFYPIVNTVYVSFLDGYNYMLGTSKGFTFNNYIDILTPINGSGFGSYFEQVVQTALPNTLLYAM